jgi:hypothetical protein
MPMFSITSCSATTSLSSGFYGVEQKRKWLWKEVDLSKVTKKG